MIYRYPPWCAIASDLVGFVVCAYTHLKMFHNPRARLQFSTQVIYTSNINITTIYKSCRPPATSHIPFMERLNSICTSLPLIR